LTNTHSTSVTKCLLTANLVSNATCSDHSRAE